MHHAFGKQRPVNLDLLTIKQPPPAIVSIMHRISGVVIAVLLPFMVCGLSCSLQSPESFLKIKQCLESFGTRFFIWVFLSALAFHVIAGLRHLLMDAGFAETASAGKKTAYIALVFAFVVIVSLGICLW